MKVIYGGNEHNVKCIFFADSSGGAIEYYPEKREYSSYREQGKSVHYIVLENNRVLFKIVDYNRYIKKYTMTIYSKKANETFYNFVHNDIGI